MTGGAQISNDEVDIDQLKLLARLEPGQRIRPMLAAQAFIRATIRGRLRQLHPTASDHEIGMMVLEELKRVDQLWAEF